MKKCLPLLITAVLLNGTVSNAQVLRAFSQRYYNPSTRGNIVYVSNSIISTSGIGAGVPGTGELPPTGTTRDNDGQGINIDVDADATTFNSSTSDLNIASCSNVLFAGLYWGAGEGNNGGNTSWYANHQIVKLKLPGAASYTNITSTQTDLYNSGNPVGFSYTGFQCFANITALVNGTNPNGTYTVANVVPPIGKTNAFGGWTIVIVYGNPSLPSRNLTVFDGCAIVIRNNPPVDVPISGFLTPPTGPVSCELGTVAYDGDRGWTDSFCFKQNGAAAFYNLTPNATANLNDMWNSAIAYKGAVVTTRNPAFNNTLGYDANIIEVPNTGNLQLSNSQISATVRFSSPQEMIIGHVLTTSVSQYNPTFAFDKTATDINGGSFLPGDSLLYKINYANLGNDSSTNTIITDNLPSGTAYIPGSINIGGVTKTDASGDDEAEYDFTNNRILFRIGVGATSLAGGKIGPGVANTVEFKVLSASACKIVSCVGSLRNSARINYSGKLSGNPLFDSSGVVNAGCIVKGPVIHPLAGPCFTPKDTLLVNKCASFTVTLPWWKYAGYTFYSAKPFIPANIYNQYTPVSNTGIYWAYFTNGPGCSDTARIAVIITICIDIDDDNDAIPDYVECNNPVALQDANGNGIPNWKDPLYIGYVDTNLDGVNDNFDFGADSDNDGIPNFYDTDFPGFADTNGDGVNDNADIDKDGIPNQYDLDSDNDGIPDVVESYGVDTNGDGIIDNYTDTDNDGFSQNVDANNTGVLGSGNGLGNMDFDFDGIPNYLDTDSDNDGIPDVIEAGGTDANNKGLLDTFADANSDGISDNNVNGTALLMTGIDVAPVDGRADNYPNKNKDQDIKPNAYDLDSDGDGIVDVIEAGLIDADLDGIADGVIGNNGWSATVSGMPSLNLRNTDGIGSDDYLDIDSDEDGIPDNIEGLSTAGYKLPVITDTDGDGLVNTYDNKVGFGGAGIFVYDHDADGTPDYRDLDTDADGQPDIVEGNDFNLNGIADDIVTLTGIDTDGDGLDNRFDSLNSVINIKGTSYRMGTGGTFAGDAAPGSRTTVQKKYAANIDRDWRFVGVVLFNESFVLNAVLQGNEAILNWTILTSGKIDHFELERSNDNTAYKKVGSEYKTVKMNEAQSFSYKDEISKVNDEILYYRVKAIGVSGDFAYSNIVALRKPRMKIPLTLMPNPAGSQMALSFYAENAEEISIRMIDNSGKIVFTQQQKVSKGNNVIRLTNLSRFSNGAYIMQVQVNNALLTQKFILFN